MLVSNALGVAFDIILFLAGHLGVIWTIVVLKCLMKLPGEEVWGSVFLKQMYPFTG